MKKIIILFILFIPIVVLGYNETINTLCTNKEKDKLRKSVLDFSYALEKYKEEGSIYYKITIYNMNSEVHIDYDKKTYTENNNIINNVIPGTKASLRMYANPKGVCEGYNITTKIITVPYYNKFKDNKLCVGNEEYFLCKENTHTVIDEEEFIKQITNYVKDKNELVVEKDKEENVIHEMDNFEKLLIFLDKYYLFIFFPIITFGTLSIIFLAEKKKRELF